MIKKLQISWLTLFVIFSFYTTALAQRLSDDTASSPAFKNAIAFSNNTFSKQLHLFNGEEVPDYHRLFTKGQPYFITNAWSKGTIIYEGISYEDVSILYDIITDDILILSHNNISRIRLIKEKISHFSFAGHSFVNLNANSFPATGLRAGFYDVLVTGKITLLAKRTKQVQPIAGQSIELEILDKDYYYVKKDSSYVSVNNRKDFLNQFDDKKKEVQKFIKQTRHNYTEDRENTMVKAVEYYNQVTR